MPRDVETYLPFPSRISEDVDRAGELHLEWPISFGLLPSDKARQRHVQGLYPHLAGRFHPSASGGELDLAVDQLSWFFIFDDYLDTQIGTEPDCVRRLTNSLCAVIDASACDKLAEPPASSLILAFAEIWSRSCEGMSQSWRTRAAKSWQRYFIGHVAEAENRNTSSAPDLDDHLALRASTIGVFPILDLAERLGGFEVCDRVHESAELAEMRTLSAEIVVLDNEIFSLEKEEAAGDHNLILTLEAEHGNTRPQAIETVCDMIKTRVQRFLTLQSRLSDLHAQLDLSSAEQHNLSRYLHDGLHPVMRGAHDWSRRSFRYRANYLPQSEALTVSEITLEG